MSESNGRMQIDYHLTYKKNQSNRFLKPFLFVCRQTRLKNLENKRGQSIKCLLDRSTESVKLDRENQMSVTRHHAQTHEYIMH